MSSPHALPPPPAPGEFAPTPTATPADGAAALWPARNSWLPARGQPTEKLCVHVAVSLRGRLDRTQRCLRRYPDIAGVLRSRNAVMAYACYRLLVELDGPAATTVGPATEPERPARAAAPLEAAQDTPAAHPRAAHTEDPAAARARQVPQWAAGAPLYRMPWEADFAERRCQLTLRLPPPFAARLRQLHSRLLVCPESAARPELAAVFTFSELVALACHELCGHIEADTLGPDQP